MRGHIAKKGKKYYIVVDLGRNENGKRKQKWLSGFDTKKEAEKALAETITKIENNDFILPKRITFKEFANFWMENHVKPDLSPTTAYGYKQILDLHIIPFIGNIELQKLRPVDIQQYYNIKREQLSGKTLLQHHRILHKMLGYAMTLQLIPSNPADKVEAPKAKKYKSRVLTLDEIKQMQEALKGTELEAPINLTLDLGLRRGELLALKWDDIDLDQGIIEIKNNLVRAGKELIFKEPKSETSLRRLKLSPTVVSMLRTHKKRQAELKLMLGSEYHDNGLVFCEPNGDIMNPTKLSRKFSEFLKRNNLPHIRFHDLRHTNATLMLKAKIAPKVASARLGHSTITITMDLYSHMLTDMDEEVANTLEDVLYRD